jgi:hypothetical protein
MNAYIYFSTFARVNADADYVGLGSSSADLLPNTVLVAQPCNATSLGVSVRQALTSSTCTATLYVNGSPSTLATVVPPGTTVTVALGQVPLASGDLITLFITSDIPQTVLPLGMCGTVTCSMPT